MIVVDTSAVIAMIKQEPNFPLISARLLADRHRVMPATALLETAMVLSRDYSDPRALVGALSKKTNLVVQPIDETHAAMAQQAFLTYGKGRHPARLNFGDCFSYAVAKLADAPLLFVGTDFAQTDLRAAL